MTTGLAVLPSQDLIGQVRAFALGIDELGLEDAAAAHTQLQVLADAVKRFRTGEAAQREISRALTLAARRIGQLVAVVGLTDIGISRNLQGAMRNLAGYADATFDAALEEVSSLTAAFSFRAVAKRCHIISGGVQYGRDWFSLDEEDNHPGARHLLAAAIAGKIDEAGDDGVTIREITAQLLQEDAALVLSVDREGRDIVRKHLRRLGTKRGDRGGWPAIFTCPSSTEVATYVAFENATVGAARSHLSAQRINAVRVIRRFRELRRMVAALDGLAADVRLSDLEEV